MWHFSFFCFFILTTTSALSMDKINQTCTKCAEMSTAFSYNVCFTSLEAVPASHDTNLQELALIALDLAIQNATASISTIEKLLSSESFDPFAMVCLNDCLGLYLDGVDALIKATGAFITGSYDVANVWVSSVMDAATTCEDGFKEQEGQVSPLTKENYFLFQLCDIALCISKLLSLTLSVYSQQVTVGLGLLLKCHVF